MRHVAACARYAMLLTHAIRRLYICLPLLDVANMISCHCFSLRYGLLCAGFTAPFIFAATPFYAAFRCCRLFAFLLPLFRCYAAAAAAFDAAMPPFFRFSSFLRH